MSLKIRLSFLTIVAIFLFIPMITQGHEASIAKANGTNEVLPVGTIKAILKTNKFINIRKQFYLIGFFFDKDKSFVYIANTFNLTDFDSLEIFSNDGQQISHKIAKLPNSLFYRVELSTPMKSLGLTPNCEESLAQKSNLKTWTFRLKSLDRNYFNKGLIARRFTTTKKDYNGKVLVNFPFEFSVHPINGTPVVRESDGKMVGIYGSYFFKSNFKYFILPAHEFCNNDFIKAK